MLRLFSTPLGDRVRACPVGDEQHEFPLALGGERRGRRGGAVGLGEPHRIDAGAAGEILGQREHWRTLGARHLRQLPRRQQFRRTDDGLGAGAHRLDGHLFCERTVAARILDRQRDQVVAHVRHGQLRPVAHLAAFLAEASGRRKRKQHRHLHAALAERHGFLSSGSGFGAAGLVAFGGSGIENVGHVAARLAGGKPDQQGRNERLPQKPAGLSTAFHPVPRQTPVLSRRPVPLHIAEPCGEFTSRFQPPQAVSAAAIIGPPRLTLGYWRSAGPAGP